MVCSWGGGAIVPFPFPCRESVSDLHMSMMQKVLRLGFTVAILFVCCLLCSCTGDGEGPRRRVSVVRRGPWQHEVVEGVHPEAAITATFTNQINKNGSVVRIHLKFLLQLHKQHVLTRFIREFCLLSIMHKKRLSSRGSHLYVAC